MKIFKLLEKRYIYFFLSILYKLLLDISYVNFVNPLYGYSGFHINFNILQYFFGWILFLLLLILSPHLMNKISDYFHSQALFALLAPIIVLYGMDSNLPLTPVIYSLASILFIRWLTNTSIKTPKISIVPIIKNGDKIFYLISLIMVIYLVCWYFFSGAVNNINFNITKVYEFREKNSAITNIGILAYVNDWVYSVFSLSLLGYSLWRKKYITFLFVIICQIFFYSISAHKSVLFAPFFVIGIYFYFSRTNALSSVPLVFSTTVLCGLLLYNIVNETIFPSMFIRRVFFVPANLTYVYFEFFQHNPYSMWSNSILKFIQPNIYEAGISKTIGIYIGTDIYANNGYISSGFAQAGLLGIFLYSIILGIYLKWLNILSNKGPTLWLGLILVVTPLRSLLISSDLLTVMLTHGLFVATLMLILLRKNK
ncbi:hypothetical protein; putative membrane protein [Xenorhabdus bovienii str. Jollieti]|nr:hypothetical protein; putative membrane protein [Xenorhabdus bovienii str. Jollieti]